MARPKSDIDKRIVRAARARFLASGVDGASLRQIARDAGTNIGMVYYYFPTKDDLFLAVVEERYGAILADLEAALLPDVPVEDRIRRMSVRLGALDEEERDVVRLVVREALTSSSRLERLIERGRRGHLAMLAASIAGGIRGGEIDDRWHPMLLTVATLALTVVPQLLRRGVGERVSAEEVPTGSALADQLVEILFEGIRAKGRAS